MRPTILLTRPEHQATRFARNCRDSLGDRFDLLISPVIDIKRRDIEFKPPKDSILIFSSENAVIAVAGMFSGHKAYCVGDRTAQAAVDAGFDPISAGGAAKELLTRIGADAPDQSLVYLRGAITRLDVAAALRKSGFDAQDIIVYDQVPRPLSSDATTALNGENPIILPLFSPRSAELLSNVATTAQAPVIIAAFSEAVAAAWTAPSQKIAIAPHPNVTSMIETLRCILSDTLS